MFAAHQRLVVAHDSSPCKSGRHKTAIVFHSSASASAHVKFAISKICFDVTCFQCLQRNFQAIVDRALELGINHIETATVSTIAYYTTVEYRFKNHLLK
jgi:hypothetical protein